MEQMTTAGYRRTVDRHSPPGSKVAWSAILDRLAASMDFERVVSVIVFGSAAREDTTSQSDLDVLVVVEDAPRAVVVATDRATFTPLVFTARALLREASVKPSFVSHLLDEGRVIYERPDWQDLQAELAIRASDTRALHREVQRRVRHLDPLHPVERYRNSPITAMSQIYGVARSLVIARLLEHGVREYSWRRAFDRYAEMRPDLRHDIEALKALRPYYEYSHARPGAMVPSRSVELDELQELVDSAERLAT